MDLLLIPCAEEEASDPKMQQRSARSSPPLPSLLAADHPNDCPSTCPKRISRLGRSKTDGEAPCTEREEECIVVFLQKVHFKVICCFEGAYCYDYDLHIADILYDKNWSKLSTKN